MKEYYPTLKAKMLLYSNKSDSYLLVISHSKETVVSSNPTFTMNVIATLNFV